MIEMSSIQQKSHDGMVMHGLTIKGSYAGEVMHGELAKTTMKVMYRGGF